MLWLAVTAALARGDGGVPLTPAVQDALDLFRRLQVAADAAGVDDVPATLARVHEVLARLEHMATALETVAALKARLAARA